MYEVILGQNAMPSKRKLKFEGLLELKVQGMVLRDASEDCKGHED